MLKLARRQNDMFAPPLIIITCYDIEQSGVLFPYPCCGSCHEDYEEDGFPLLGADIPKNAKGRRSAVEFEVCCMSSEAVERLGRSEIARIVRSKRKIYASI
jgi:hypothetical protein